jgi:ribonuclease HII
VPTLPFDRRLDPLWRELARLARLGTVERELHRRGFARVAGVDEAGRGCFAGPVVAAAVILPDDAPLLGIDDSKILDARARGRSAEQLRRLEVEVGVGIVGADFIDANDILAATKRAMMEALAALPSRPDAVVTDAVDLPACVAPVLPVIRGDSRVLAVAAASIVAKTTRDSLMDSLDAEFPWYGFGRNRGYGTLDHREAIRRHGPSPIHRFTFRGVIPAGA